MLSNASPGREEEQAVWEEYWRTRDVELRNELAMDYMYIVRLYAFQMRGTYKNFAEMEDMINQGFVVLLEAIENYDPEKKSQFKSYASIRVRGAIIDFVRNQDWVTKRLKKEAVLLSETTDKLGAQLGRMPTTEELAAHLNLDVRAVEKIIAEEHMFHLLSYEELVDVGLYGTKGFRENMAHGVEQPGFSLEEKELRDVIGASLDELTDREKLVMSLHYYEGLKKKDIAYIMGVSPSRICQMHNGALTKMKQKLQNYLYGEGET
ncbi:MAG: FliA/WhiG family RNA polymerase sigma factor [Gracilibacteraceae bacterium]|jgi:RNA polymerase sigma factor for flagellar operon FliA|nr:FliA/WhiG family RNA polymerase sigma factor [Gracilibacteraceae bacterium]